MVGSSSIRSAVVHLRLINFGDAMTDQIDATERTVGAALIVLAVVFYLASLAG
jgi:hydrogenase/urease accessory protein HupE